MTKEILYRVAVFITTLEQQSNRNCLIEDDLDFPINTYMSGEEISEMRKKAMAYYMKRLEELSSERFNLPFAIPSDLKMSDNAAFGCTLSILELYEDGEEEEWFLAGEEEDEIKEGEAEEERIINEILITNQ